MGWVSSEEAYNGGERLMGLLQTDDMPNFSNDDQVRGVRHGVASSDGRMKDYHQELETPEGPSCIQEYCDIRFERLVID